jgi:hypothetical protein
MKGPESAVIEVHELPAQIRGLALASFSMSFFSMLIFWLIPWGFTIAIAGSGLAVLSMLLGVRTVARGVYFPIGGLLCAGATITGALLTTKLNWLFFLEF